MTWSAAVIRASARRIALVTATRARSLAVPIDLGVQCCLAPPICL
jgi:hypothetical protein